jgi:tetratricopeptide (TPR) repeat protein
MNNLADAGLNFALAVKDHEVVRLMELAVLDHQAGHLEKAAQAYQQILAVDERNVMALNNLSLMLDKKTALKLLQTALEIDPNYVDALINTSSRMLELGNLNEAQAYAQRLFTLAPEDERVRNLRHQLEIAQSHNADVLPDDVVPFEKGLPLFSVIIPTHRRANLLERALASISQQTLNNHHEIIVISDCQDAETEEVCRQWLKSSDTYVRRSGVAGPSLSRNLGIQMARGEVVLFLDDDDAWHPELLASLKDCDALRQGQPVYFNCSIVKESRRHDGVQKHSEVMLDTKHMLTSDVFVKNQVHMSCFATPRLLLQDLRFDPHMRAYEDWDFLLFLFERKMPSHFNVLGSQIHEVDDETSDRRGSSQIANDQNAIIDYMYVYHRHPVKLDLQIKRAELLATVGLKLLPELL